MRKSDIVEWIYENEDLKTMKKKDIKNVVGKIFDKIIYELENGKDGDKIQISGFGTFRIKKRKPKIGRNPKTKEEKIIPERLAISFKPSKKLIQYINSNGKK